MRDIIDLAVEKGMRAYIRTAERAGLTLGPGGGPASPQPDEELFDAEQERAWD
jgi:hypothetical protein